MQLLNSAFFVIHVPKNRKQNSEFKCQNPNFITPPKSLAFDAYNHINWQHYYQLGEIHAISIFMHLSETMHYAWINELYRILKKDGILIFTTHGELCKTVY
nr:hypothetical protein [uncultured Draconibacterium sp.]